MKTFMDDNFLLDGETAGRLYHDYAKGMPILDYHCHVPPQQIAENQGFENITQVWLRGDHYKWRAMRTNGVPEKLITGDTPDRDKFNAWAATVPRTLGNPLYHWTHLELRRVFSIEETLSPASADRIWNRTAELLSSGRYNVRGIMGQFPVAAVCTTDDPTDSLEYHDAIAADASFSVSVFPTFRPDKAHALEDPVRYAAWIRQLEKAAGTSITGFESLVAALRARHEYFAAHGCRISDHGLTFIPAVTATSSRCDTIFRQAMAGEKPASDDIYAFRATLLTELGRMDATSGWTMQLHLGAMRNTNSRMFAALGPDAGFDVIGDWPQAEGIAGLLDRLDSTGQLPKTILYVLNPADNELIGTMIGAFQDGSVVGKMQFGSGWWFNDQKDGMERHLTALSSLGLLSRFVGMLTDSRSFLSYPRHEYFRRILCNLVGGWMDRGEIPSDIDAAGSMVRDICFNNASAYFGLQLKG